MATLWITFLAWVVVSSWAPHEASAAVAGSAVIRVPLTIHVATVGGRSVVSEHQIVDAVRLANRELAAFDIHVYVRSIEPMRGGSRVENARQRLDLADFADRDGSLHVFYVERVRLTNPHKGDRRVSGVHWRYHGLTQAIRAREYVAVSRDAPSTTLVHEIGHAFGLAHESSPKNLMCSCRRAREPGFDTRQGTKMRAGARRFLARARAR